MNRIEVILTLDMENLPANFPEILKQEQEIVAKWKENGFLEHLYLREARNGAVLIFKDLEEEKVKELMQELPFFKLSKQIEYLNLILQF
jgi:muconolactone D-isomerase